MKNVSIFPYHTDLEIIAEHVNGIKEFQIVGFISYKEDRKKIDYLNAKIGVGCVSDIQILQNSDAIILVDNYRNYCTDKYYEIIEEAIKLGIEIYITPLAIRQLELEKYRGYYSVFSNEVRSINPERYDVLIRPHRHMYDINVPIIGVFGQGKHSGKFEGQILLNEVAGGRYRTITLCSNPLGRLFGYYTMPSFMFENISLENKVLMFNHYVKNLCSLNGPELIIIGVPEGIMPFCDAELHHFAEYALVVSSAVSIDMAILCMYYVRGGFDGNGLKTYIRRIENRFLVPIDLVTICCVDYEISKDEIEEVIYERISNRELENNTVQYMTDGVNVVHLFNLGYAKSVIQSILYRLEENINAV